MLLEHDIQPDNYELDSYIVGAPLVKNIGEDVIDSVNNTSLSLFKNFPLIPVFLGLGLITLIILKRK